MNNIKKLEQMKIEKLKFATKEHLELLIYLFDFLNEKPFLQNLIDELYKIEKLPETDIKKQLSFIKLNQLLEKTKTPIFLEKKNLKNLIIYTYPNKIELYYKNFIDKIYLLKILEEILNEKRADKAILIFKNTKLRGEKGVGIEFNLLEKEKVFEKIKIENYNKISLLIKL